jgi:hypothetical protein
VSAIEKQYGWTVLGTGFARMWRSALPAILVSLVNAVVQASTLALSPFWLALGISAAVLLISFALLAHLAVRNVRQRSAVADLTSVDLLRFSIWVVLWTVLVTVGLALYFWPGVILLALTPFVPVAAAAGAGNALGANFRAIADRPVRWLVTVVVTLLVIAVVWLTSGLAAFFVGGWVAAFATWLVIGFVAAWLLTAWAALFLSTRAAPQQVL